MDELMFQAGGTPLHHARNLAWGGYLFAKVWAPPEIAELWYLLAARLQAECEGMGKKKVTKGASNK